MQIRVVLRLGLLALITAIVISLTYQLNMTRIMEAEAAYEDRQLLAISNQFQWQIRQLDEDLYAMSDDVELKGFLFSAQTNEGYNGTIRLWLAITPSGEVLGVRTRSHQETPGLGDKIELAVSNWILSFNGKSLVNVEAGQWDVRKNGGSFDSFTGATITPRAVVAGVYEGLQFYEEQKVKWQEAADDTP